MIRTSTANNSVLSKAAPKKYLLSRLPLILIITQIVACGSVSKIVYQTKVAENKISFYITDNPNYRKGEGKFYARVDGDNVRNFYSFREKKSSKPITI